jgi:pantoate--beta-alanine ligase
LETLGTIGATRGFVAGRRGKGRAVALVPTMGSLHEGHLSLVRIARGHADTVIASVFVNPLQFGEGEDFERYPRDLDRDRALLAGEGVDAVFAPAVAEMYPPEAGSPTRVEVPALSGILEGEFRPGHFAGVATVVTKLFNIVAPDVAVFGEKDFQQLAVIRRLVRDLCLPVRIVGAPIARDADGLALSSRNRYLSASERHAAPALFRTLDAARRRVAGGERTWAAVEADATAALSAAGFVPDYVAVRRADDLTPPGEGDVAAGLVVLGAARLGRTRLIDNVRVG